MTPTETARARRTAARVHARLLEPGARPGKRETVALLGLVERLCDALDEARKREDYTYAYGRLVEDWNDLVAGLAALGIAVSQPGASGSWRWACGGQAGTAPTIPEAYLAALRATGDRQL